MRISEVSEQVGLPAKTIRFYESRGVVPEPAREANGYRAYAERDVQRLRMVANARAVGLPLEAIRELVEVESSGDRPCLRLRALAQSQLQSVRELIEDLRGVEDQLTGIIASTDEPQPAGLVMDAACPVLEASRQRSA